MEVTCPRPSWYFGTDCEQILGAPAVISSTGVSWTLAYFPRTHRQVEEAALESLAVAGTLLGCVPCFVTNLPTPGTKGHSGLQSLKFCLGSLNTLLRWPRGNGVPTGRPHSSPRR